MDNLQLLHTYNLDGVNRIQQIQNSSEFVLPDFDNQKDAKMFKHNKHFKIKIVEKTIKQRLKEMQPLLSKEDKQKIKAYKLEMAIRYKLPILLTPFSKSVERELDKRGVDLFEPPDEEMVKKQTHLFIEIYNNTYLHENHDIPIYKQYVDLQIINTDGINGNEIIFTNAEKKISNGFGASNYFHLWLFEYGC